MTAYAPDRRFVVICTLSLLLHGLIFAFLAMPRQSRPLLPPVLMATLRQVISPNAGPAADMPRPVAPAAVPPKVRPSPSPAQTPLPVRPSRTAGPTTTPVIAQSIGAVSAAASQPESTPSVVPPSPLPAPDAAPARPQVDALAAYRQRLTALLAGQQEYPRVAAMRGWEGEVRLRLRVARKGNLLGVQLDHSSGFDVLDRHALAMLEALNSLPPLPEALEVSEILVVVPITYKLKKST